MLESQVDHGPVAVAIVDDGNRGDDDDASLLVAIGQGDRHAFEQLFRRFHTRVHRFVFRMLRDADLADEVTNDTLFTVWTNAAGFAHQSSASTWILGIGYKKTLKALQNRKRYNQRHGSIDDAPELVDQCREHDPEGQLHGRQEGWRVSEAVSRLSHAHQAVVRLTALGHSTAEIALIVDCPKNTVKTRMYHARLQLRELLGVSDEPVL